MTTPPTIDIPALLAATCDLEVGHPIEAVLRAHGVPENFDTYDVLKRFRQSLAYSKEATTLEFKNHWAAQAETLRPCVAAIAEWFADQVK